MTDTPTTTRNPVEVLAEYLTPIAAYTRNSPNSPFAPQGPSASSSELTQIEDDPFTWLRTIFPDQTSKPFATFHQQFWNWLWDAAYFPQDPRNPNHYSAYTNSIRPFVSIWSRGAGKSQTIELAAAAIAAASLNPDPPTTTCNTTTTTTEPPPSVRGTRRRYMLYVCATQDQADDHVQNVASLLESPALAYYYPQLSQRAISKFGHVKGWRRNRLRTASGFTIDAIGLDTAVRGAKIDEDRPDTIAFDDLDSDQDTPAISDNKVKAITTRILPAATPDSILMAVQNLIIMHGVFARLARLYATQSTPELNDFMTDRIVSGPYKAINNFSYQTTITPNGSPQYTLQGKPTWSGLDFNACLKLISRIGMSAFLRECQHEVANVQVSMFGHLRFTDYRIASYTPEYHELHPKITSHAQLTPDAQTHPLNPENIIHTSVWVDPAVTETDQSDSQGIVVATLSIISKPSEQQAFPSGVVVEDNLQSTSSQIIKVTFRYAWEGRKDPNTVLQHALDLAFKYDANSLGIETNQGGDLWEGEYNRLIDDLPLDLRNRAPSFVDAKATSSTGSKAHRAQRLLAAYERGDIAHLYDASNPTVVTTLEPSLQRFLITKPFDLTDAAVWAWAHLTSEAGPAAWAGLDPTAHNVRTTSTTALPLASARQTVQMGDVPSAVGRGARGGAGGVGAGELIGAGASTTLGIAQQRFGGLLKSGTQQSRRLWSR